MLVFPNCKINLGLNVTKKRSDGFHDIETVFYPVNWCDALEVIENKSPTQEFEFSQSGLIISGKPEDNLIYKAYKLITANHSIPPIKVHLHKNLPMGAGLGGGSADAAFFITMLNNKFKLGLSYSEEHELASKLGSDCSFFIKNKAVIAKGRGDEFTDITVNLSKYFILLVFPQINSNTKEAYDGIIPKTPKKELKTIIEKVPINEWESCLFNDFEETIFVKYPEIKNLKELLYNNGALYASMSGSGSSVFGIFENEPLINFNLNYRYHLQTPSTDNLL